MGALNLCIVFFCLGFPTLSTFDLKLISNITIFHILQGLKEAFISGRASLHSPPLQIFACYSQSHTMSFTPGCGTSLSLFLHCFKTCCNITTLNTFLKFLTDSSLVMVSSPFRINTKTENVHSYYNSTSRICKTHRRVPFSF